MLSHGLDLFQVSLLNAGYNLTIFLFEIPTGAFADSIGRRKSILIGQALAVLMLGIFYISTNFKMFLLAEVTAAISATFISGALDAWLVDSLKNKDDTRALDMIFTYSETTASVAGLIGGLIGAYLGAIALNIPFGIGAIVALSSLAVAFLFVYEKPVLSRQAVGVRSGFNQMANTVKDSVNYGIKHKVVFWLIISSLVSSLAFMPLNMYWSPRLNDLAGNRVWLMGWIWALISLFMILGNYLTKSLLKKNKSYYWILIADAVVLGLPVLFSALSSRFLPVLIGILMYEIGRGMRNPVYKSYINKHIPGEQRATILSFNSMVSTIGAVIGLVALGFVAKHYSIQSAWFIGGLFMLTLIPIFMRVDKHEKALDNLRDDYAGADPLEEIGLIR